MTVIPGPPDPAGEVLGDGTESVQTDVQTGAMPLDSRALDRSMVRGLAWTGSARLITQGFSWLSTVIVARLLTPADYGLVSMATLYLGLIKLLSEFGIGSVVTLLRTISDDEVAQLNTFSILFGVTAFLVSAAMAVPLGIFFHAPNLPLVVVVMSITPIVTSFRSIPQGLMERDLDFRGPAIMDGARSVASLITVLPLAYLGFGYWALVLNELVGVVVASVVALWRRGHRFAWPHFAALREALSLSRNIVISRLAWFTYQNADFLVTGRVLGQAALGAYGFAWTITSLPVEKITTLVIGVTPSILARAQDDRVLMRRYVKALTEGLALITFPLALGVALVASDFVPVVLGEKWRGVILPLQVLSLYMSVRSVTPLIAPVLNVSGASRHVMWNSLASAVVMPIAFIIGSHWGTVGIATAWVIASPFLLVPLYRDMFRVLQMSTREYVESLMPALSGCVVMALCVWAMRAMLGNQLPQLTRLIIQVAVGAIAYGTVMLTVHRARITNFIAAVRNAGA